MAKGALQLMGLCIRFKPHIIMVLAQLGYTFLYFITEASFNHGLNTFVYITYRNIVAGLALWPFAYLLERKLRPKLTWRIFIEIFVLSLLGCSLSLNMYFTSLKYTSPTFLASMVNTVASLTFVLAVLIGLEILDMRSARGIAKVVGTLVSLTGVMVMTLYKGPEVRSIGHALIHIHGNVVHEDWVKGSILTIASCLAWAAWYIMQAYTLKKYPAQLSLTTWMSLVGAAQSAAFTVIVEHKPQAWTIGFNIDFWSIMYGGVVCSGVIVFAQLWVTDKRGPVFVTMFNPLSTIMVAVLGFFVLGEKLYTGSIIGAVAVISGLYLLLWGKDKDQVVLKEPLEHSFSSEEERMTKDSLNEKEGKRESLKVSLEV